MKFSQWTTFARVIAKIGFFTTSFFSTLFLILTIFYVKEKVGSYRYLLLLFPVTGFFFVSFEYLLDPFFHSFNGGFTLFRLSSFDTFSLTFNTCILSCYVALYGSTISILVLQFSYRYWAIFKPRNIKIFFDGFRFIIPLCYMTAGGFSWWCASFLFTRLDDYASAYLEKDVFDSYGVILSEQPALVLVAYDDQGKIRIKNSLGLLIMTISMVPPETDWIKLNMNIQTFQYSIIIILACIMGLKMHKKISILSRKMQRMHRQFYHALVLQITAPTLTLFFPVFVLFYVPYLDIEISFPTGTCLSMFAMYPAMDIFIMIYIASYYNKALRDCVSDILKFFVNTDYSMKEGSSVKMDTVVSTVTS